MKSKKTALKVVPVKPGQNLRSELLLLKKQFGACGLKLSTEDAAMSLEQIAFWAESAGNALPAMVKIGGPNARNDIKQLLPMHIDGLIAPMVESPYGLENFIAAVRDFTTPMQFERLKKQINIETETAVRQLDSILSAPEAKYIDEITIGCSDLSESMKQPRWDASFMALVVQVVKKIQKNNISVSVGGGITPDTIEGLLEQVRPDKFNTRVITFKVEPDRDYRLAVQSALRFEILMLEHDSCHNFISRDEEKFRIKELKKRLK
ncbi:MAG: hypothetical protein HOL15_04715 [Nitrospinaceae bacterium]|nr:hypothetical protein [Nitrospina sp.]MBT5376095.1 hypothetical protein [Nitrospinaceae bacterium]MBT5869405.1 hypothetical protein [Nitrospinaceae bacterium]MBT6347172.1 hypothetical protein [Nitrospina sp.]